MVVYENKIVSLSSAKFIGCAVISTLHTQHKKTEDNTILNDLGWEIYPIGIYNMAKIHNKCTTIPIIITENGIADKNDRNRGSFIIAHLEQLGRVINDGINIIGYLHWSLLDNYEWQEGYNPERKFGLLYIDHENSNFTRLVTNGAKIYSFIIKDSLTSNEKILSSYLILVGLYYSAISVSADAKLRRTIRESALRESKFLDSIGKAYMEQEIESKVLGVAKELKQTLTKEAGFSPSLTDVEIEQYLEEVMTEVKKAKDQSEDK